MRPTKLVRATLFATTVLLAAAAGAAADSPTMTTETFVRQLNNQCPDFAIRSTFLVERQVTTFHDADGTLLRQTIVVSFRATSRTCPPATPCRPRTSASSRSTCSPARPGARARTSALFLPGGGTIQLTAGLQMRDASGAILLDGGRLDQPPSPALCEALAEA